MSDRRIPFTSEDEDRIASASLWGILAALTGILSGVVNLATTVLAHATIRQLVTQGITLLVSLLLGVWLIQACTAFRAVARTDVADKAYLLRGFDKLHAYFMTIGILMILFLVLLVLLVIAIVVFGPKAARFM